jgi:DHA1 family tetracycline resistance protein-like MFS transporter
MNWARANPVGAFAFLRQTHGLTGLVSIGFLYQLGFTVLPSIFVLYSGYRYGWTPRILGLTFLFTGVCQIAVQMFAVGPVVKRIGERGAVLLGLGGGVVGFLIYALAPVGWVYLVGTPIWAMVGFLQPGLMGLMSRRIDARHQGQLQGANQGLQGIASIAGPPIFGLSFAWAVRHNAQLHLPGLPILIAVALFVASFLLALRLATPVPQPQLAAAE